MKTRQIIVFALALSLLPLLAWGQQKGSIQVTSMAEVEIIEKNKKGKDVVRRKDASTVTVVPGTIVLFTTTFTNIGEQPATDVVITNPVPEHMTYVAGSAKGKGTKLEYSVDGGKTYAEPQKLRTRDARGRVRKAEAREYTHIKWTLTRSLQPDGSGTVTFRARVN